MKNIGLKLVILLSLVHLNHKVQAQTKALPIEEFKLKNGLEVKMISFGTIPAVSITCYVNVGKKSETPGMQYLASLVAEGLLVGNEKYTRIDQDNAVTKLGASLKASSNDNFSEVNMQFLNKDATSAMELFSNALLKPLFPDNEMKLKIEETLNYNNPRKMDINDLAAVYSNYVVFGTANPLGRNFYSEQLNKITNAQIKEFYKFNYTPKNTKLVLAGNFDKAQMKALIEKYFDTWNAEFGENNSAQYDVEDITKKEYFFVNKNKVTQTYLQWNKKAPAAGSKDALLFKLANAEFNKILFDEIRAKEGKTYGIYCSFDESANTGVYSVSTQVRNEVAYETTVSFDRVLKQFYETGITQEQLNRSKSITKSGRLSIQSPFDIISFYNPLLHKDVVKRNEYLANIDAATLEQVNKVIKKYFQPNSYKLVMSGDQAQLKEQLQKINGLAQLSYTDIEKDN